MEMVINREKKDLRNQLLAKLLSLTKEEIKRRSKNVQEILQDLPIYKKAKMVMVYFPLKGEVDLMEMIRKAKDKRFCFPVMELEKKDLIPFEVNDLDKDFVYGPWGVMQPDIEKSKKIEISEIDIVIVPGLAFDYQKNRLGRGKGFYDRFLKRIQPPTKKVGVAFDFQVLESLPIHPPLDEKVDLIVSENFII
jgi:5-formyltetrahydrofolate cyclo-ligase